MAKVSRDEIMLAAIQLFNQNGYHATSMQDIARSVSIKKPSLYHHFDSKEAILLAILDTGMEQLIQETDAIAASDMDCVDKLRAAIHAHASMIAGNPQGAAVFLREDRGLGDGYLTQYVSRRDHFERTLRSIVQEGTDQDVFRPVDVAISVQALLGMVNWMTRWYRPGGRLRPSEIADQFADLFLNGLLKK
jgi:TetR/AcrR family transcriptional regulator, cholesterol catabolism regulator